MSFVARSRYQPAVRLGNWFEDICLEQYELRNFTDLHDRGELLVDKTRKLFENFHKDIVLEAPSEHVRFGAVVQLIASDMTICEKSGSNGQPALSVTINEHVVRHSQKVNENCEITIVPSLKACVRNSFRVCASDARERTNELLKYGQRFCLECVDTRDDPLLLYSCHKSADLNTMVKATFSSSQHGELNLQLGLCLKRNCGPGKDIPAAYTYWFCQHLDPSQRFQTDGTPLPSNTPLIITHAATNRNLAAENIVIQTLFGTEFLASVQNYKNIYGREIWKNIWMIGNGHQFK